MDFEKLTEETNKDDILEEVVVLNDIQLRLIDILNNQNCKLNHNEHANTKITENLIVTNEILENATKYKSSKKSIFVGTLLGGGLVFIGGLPLLTVSPVLYSTLGCTGCILGGYLGKKIN